MKLTPRKAINKAFLKVKPNREDIEFFKLNLRELLSHSNDFESEEFHKNLIRDFLNKTYYSNEYYINTKGRNDLVIHNSKKADSSVGVIIETKKPGNLSEMPSSRNLNTKAIQELVLYFLRERITNKNLEVKHLIITNNYEWYIFDSNEFDGFFASNKELVKKFIDFEEGRLSSKTTDFFYREIAHPILDSIKDKINYTYLNLIDIKKIALDESTENDIKLIPYFKIFSPEHLLKLPYANDSNSLDKRFYNELLHIIGLNEEKKKGTHFINRFKAESRNQGSFLENTINQLDSKDILGRIRHKSRFGENREDQLFNLYLELNITWINRILFMKLLEGQLVNYHKGDNSYKFLSIDKITDYDDLDSLFFQVLARNQDTRTGEIKSLFSRVPYLNSSLFEPSEIEHESIYIGNLKDNLTIPIYSGTVLKDANGKKKIGELDALTYLFEFLDAYDFSSDGAEEIQEENKTLINASVLGLIFEKINGYKDGSFFTPGFITEYMCRETLRKAVVNKFNQVKGWQCSNLDEVYDKIEDRYEANKIVNTIKICDPAVGSGHFLVSALNEMIAIKNDLKILQDRSGKRLKEYQAEVVSDELVITDENGELYEYNPYNKESLRVQEALFHEKQTIIENCLFGVDINPNSVKICRLRLWIELLKNSYYKNEKELETLPNIDINIKTGNSLISRFDIDTDIKKALKNTPWTINEYKAAVNNYKNATSKDEKRVLEDLIHSIKTDFRTEVSKNDKKFIRLSKVKGEIEKMNTQTSLFEKSKTEIRAFNQKLKKLKAELDKLQDYIEEIKTNRYYNNAFEWRFEFPEVLDENGDFVGFDAIIGNPPYIQLQKMGEEGVILSKQDYETFAKTGDIYSLFYELGNNILKPNGYLTFITSNKWMRASYGKSLRNFFATKTNPTILIDLGGNQIFENATVDTNILQFKKAKNEEKTLSYVLKEKVLINMSDLVRQNGSINNFSTDESWVILSPIEQNIKAKIEAVGTPLKDWDISINYGIKTGFNEAFIIDGKKRKELLDEDPKSVDIIRPILRGRDIKRYNYEFADLYLINTHNGYIDSSGNPVARIDVNDFPAIKNHLDKYSEQLEKRYDKGATKYNLRNCAYMDDFLKPKLIWKRVGSIIKFAYDEKECFCLDSTCIATGSEIKYLNYYLNSRVGNFQLQDSPKTGTGDLLISVQAINPLFVPILNETNQEIFNKIDSTISFEKFIYNLLEFDLFEIDYLNSHF